MEQMDYASVLPIAPPDGLINWLIAQGAMGRELLVYRADEWRDPLTGMKEKCVRVTCSSCGDSILARHVPVNRGCAHNCAPAPFGWVDPEYNNDVHDGQDVLCPLCGTPGRARHIGNLRSPEQQNAYPLTITRIGEKLTIIGWAIFKKIDKDARTIFEAEPYEAYVVESKKVVRLAAYNKYMSQIAFSGRWEQRKKYSDVWGRAEYVYPWDADLLIGSTAENSKLDKYLSCSGTLYPVSYVKLWQKHHNVENLIMQGAGNLLADMIDRETRSVSYGYAPRLSGAPKVEEINWKEKRPAQMLGINKNEFSLCCEMGWTLDDLRFYKQAQLEKLNIRLPFDLAECKNVGYYAVNKIHKQNLPVMPTVRYILKQRSVSGKLTIGLNDLEDYWRMAVKNGINLNDKGARWPKNLVSAHDRQAEIERFRIAVERKAEQAEKAASLRTLFDKRFKALSTYGWENSGLMIRPAASYDEFIDEGASLNHCVAGYAERHAEGKTSLFWIRKTEEPDKPFFTLEFDIAEGKVKQNRGANNRDRTPEVKAFENAWLNHMQQLKSEKKRTRKNKQTINREVKVA